MFGWYTNIVEYARPCPPNRLPHTHAYHKRVSHNFYFQLDQSVKRMHVSNNCYWRHFNIRARTISIKIMSTPCVHPGVPRGIISKQFKQNYICGTAAVCISSCVCTRRRPSMMVNYPGIMGRESVVLLVADTSMLLAVFPCFPSNRLKASPRCRPKRVRWQAYLK